MGSRRTVPKNRSPQRGQRQGGQLFGGAPFDPALIRMAKTRGASRKPAGHATKLAKNLATGEANAREGRDAIRSSPLVGAGVTAVAGVVTAPAIVQDIIKSHKPGELKAALIAGGIFAAGTTAVLAGFGAGQVAWGRLKAGKNFRLLQSHLRQHPNEINAVTRKLRELGVDEGIIEKLGQTAR